jgi:hypothetical protein
MKINLNTKKNTVKFSTLLPGDVFYEVDDYERELFIKTFVVGAGHSFNSFSLHDYKVYFTSLDEEVIKVEAELNVNVKDL